MVRVAAERGVPIVLMHNRGEPRYRNLLPEVIADLWRAIDRAMDVGVPRDRLIVDPVSASARRPTTTSRCWPGSARCASSAGRSCSGTSRKSTLGKVLDLPPDQRVEATVATTVVGIAAGVGGHRPRPRRARERPGGAHRRRHRARLAAGGLGEAERERSDPARGDDFRGHARRPPREQVTPQPFEVDVELALNLQPAGLADDLALTVPTTRASSRCCRQCGGVDPVQPDRDAGRGHRRGAARWLPDGRFGHLAHPQAEGGPGRPVPHGWDRDRCRHRSA